MFDMTKDKWFIRVANQQEAISVQSWLMRHGYAWGGSGRLIREDFEGWDSEGGFCAIGMGHMGGGSLGQASPGYWERYGHHEIKVNFKLCVDEVTYPTLESEQQKQIKALEATISQAQEQIKKLKEGM